MNTLKLDSRSFTLHARTTPQTVSSWDALKLPRAASSQVSISPEATALAASAASDADRTKAERLRSDVKQTDFSNTTQAELARMANALVEAGEITADESAAFVATAHNAFPPRRSTDRFDANAHFAEMERRAQDVNRGGANDWAVEYAQHIRQMVGEVRSFASSDRLHIKV